MKRTGFLLALAVLVIGAAAAGAQESAAPAGLRGEVLFWVEDAETKLTRLAEAIPEEKYTWRPGEGVRSVSEVFLHLTAGNYTFARLVGTPPPEGYSPQGFERSTTEKAKIVEHVKASFVHLKKAIGNVDDADLENSLRLFGRDSTIRNVLLLTAVHTHEHLGQAIAYARVNGVVPPWTAERQQQQQQQPAKRP